MPLYSQQQHEDLRQARVAAKRGRLFLRMKVLMPKRLTLDAEEKEQLNDLLTALDPTATARTGKPRGKGSVTSKLESDSNTNNNTTGASPTTTTSSSSTEKDEKFYQPSISDLKFFGGFGRSSGSGSNDYF